MFFNDADLVSRKKAVLRQLPEVPDTGWTPPTEFPNLSAASVLSFDVETKELDFAHGPGWARGQGHIVGVSVAAMASDGKTGAWYFPVRHEVHSQDNLDPGRVFGWLKSVLETPNVDKIGANLIYDVGWLTEESIEVSGDLHDVQFAEALLDESARVGLGSLGRKYIGEDKTTDMLYEWLRAAYPDTKERERRGDIYRAPPSLVGHYAEQDALLPLHVAQKQLPLLAADDLYSLYRMECESIPMLVKMRQRGVRIDVERASHLHETIGADIAERQAALDRKAGFPCNVNSPKDLERLFTEFSIPVTKLPTGRPSFAKGVLSGIDHEVVAGLLDIRQRVHVRETFLRSYLLDRHRNGIVNGSFHPLKDDNNGARTGRYAATNPNLQNIPVRSEMGRQVRTCFVPFEGHEAWTSVDYSQIEYRLLVHFAVGRGADAARKLFNDDPTTDYHRMTQDLVFDQTGKTVERKPIKNINFGLLYGMGRQTLAGGLRLSSSNADDLFDAYHAGNPYVSDTMKATSKEAETYGFITTILGRRLRFNLWEPRDVDYDNRQPALPLDTALRAYGTDIRRAYLYKAINGRLQGSSADMIKSGMLKCYKDGIYDAIGTPVSQVYDEVNGSLSDRSPATVEAYREMCRIMETAIPLRVPVKVDREIGPNWGTLSDWGL